MLVIQSALACGVPFSSPIIFSIFKSKPIPLKNFCIAGAASCGLAVNTNISVLPNLSFNACALPKKGPRLPAFTLVNSLKSKSAPLASKASERVANSVASILPLVPLGSV